MTKEQFAKYLEEKNYKITDDGGVIVVLTTKDAYQDLKGEIDAIVKEVGYNQSYGVRMIQT